MRRTATTFLGLAVVLASASAMAQAKTFSNRGTFAISADRLFGIYIGRQDIESNGLPVRVESHYDSTEIGLLWQGGGHLTPYTVPRGAVDYFVIDHLSIGGTLAFASTDVDYPGGASVHHTGFLFGPRVGYATMFNNWAGIWPRGGFSYYAFNGDRYAVNDVVYSNGDFDQFALNAEVMFVLAPAEGIAILLGPTLDFGITGRIDAQPQRADLHQHAFGFITAGVMGWL